MIHHLPAQAYAQIREKEWIRLDKKQLIETAVHLLQSVDPDTIEVINFDRTEYDDGSVGFSVNLTTPAIKKTKGSSVHTNEEGIKTKVFVDGVKKGHI